MRASRVVMLVAAARVLGGCERDLTVDVARASLCRHLATDASSVDALLTEARSQIGSAAADPDASRRRAACWVGAMDAERAHGLLVGVEARTEVWEEGSFAVGDERAGTAEVPTDSVRNVASQAAQACTGPLVASELHAVESAVANVAASIRREMEALRDDVRCEGIREIAERRRGRRRVVTARPPT